MPSKQETKIVISATDKTRRAFKSIKRSLFGLNKEVDKTKRSFAALAGAAGLGLLTKRIIGQIDTYQALSNRLKLVTSDAENLATIQRELFNIAQDSRGSLEGSIDLYTRFARTTKELDISQNRLLAITESVNQAITISGSSTEAANAAIIQLGQGLAAGALRGQELNSVMEQTPRLARALADGLGVTIGQLREMGKAGEITSEAVVRAIESQAGALASEFDQMEVTVSQALQSISNIALKTFGEMDASGLVESLQELGRTLQDPAIVNGLQSLAGGLIKVVEISIKGASAFAEFGEAIGVFFAQAITPDLNERARVLQERIAEINKMFTSGDFGLFGGPSRELKQELKDANIELADIVRQVKELQELGSAAKPLPQIEEIKAKVEPKEETKTEEKARLKAQKAQERLRERLAQQFETIRQSLLAEDTLLSEKHDERQAKLLEALEAKAITESEFRQTSLALSEEFQNKLTEIQGNAEKRRDQLRIANQNKELKQTFGMLAQLTAGVAGANRAMFRINQVAAISNALLNAKESILSSYAFGSEIGGPPLGALMAGVAAAATASHVAAIASQSFGGGGTAPSLTGTGAGSIVGTIPVSQDLEQEPSQSVTINLGDDDDLISKGAVRNLIGLINEELGDGVQIIAT
jgi:tape measure domain-containing protein